MISRQVWFYVVAVCATVALVDSFSIRNPSEGKCCETGRFCTDANSCCEPEATEPRLKFNILNRKVTLYCEQCCSKGPVLVLSWTGAVKETYCPLLKCCNPQENIASVYIDNKDGVYQLQCTRAVDVSAVFSPGKVLIDSKTGYAVQADGPVTCENSTPTFQSEDGYLVVKCVK